MASTIGHPQEIDKVAQSASVGYEKVDLVFEELDRILESRFFKKAGRSRQFLDYVVRHKLEGHAEQLKERTIGIEVFHRAPGYATGDDPVVRVQAGEVRRRLEQYYQSLPSPPAVRIELQPGSYSPNICWASDNTDSKPGLANHHSSPIPSRNSSFRLVAAVVMGACAAIAFTSGLSYLRHRTTESQSTGQAKFWAPAFSTSQPVLICLAKGVTYRPSLKLYRMYARSHPGAFQTEVERSNNPLPLKSDQPIVWGDMELYDEYGVAVGDVSAALDISAFLGRLDKPLQVRIGSDYSFEDLRESPAVMIGAYNNAWTMQLMSGLHFAFVDDPQRNLSIREQVPGGRVWRVKDDSSGAVVRDYGVVSRLLEPRTGQFTVILAGLGTNGTEAAAEFVSNESTLDPALGNMPRNWQTKNMQIVLETNVIHSVPGPPHVVAAYYW